MSSFVGHSLVALAVATSVPRQRRRWWWTIWLAVVALAPDCDYLSPVLRPRLPSQPLSEALAWLVGVAPSAATVQPLRITHALPLSLLLPTLTLLLLRLWQPHVQQRQHSEVVVAGLSHPLLDLLVGVTPLPLLWPLSTATVQLPFGVLPSAGRLDLTNPYLYRNLLIEVAVLGPLWATTLLLQNGCHQTWHGRIGLAALGLLSISAMLVAAGLQR